MSLMEILSEIQHTSLKNTIFSRLPLDVMSDINVR